MCPLWPLHLFVLYAFLLGPLWILTCTAAAVAAEHLPLNFNPSSVLIQLDHTQQVFFNYTDCSNLDKNLQLYAESAARKIVSFDDKVLLKLDENCVSNFNLTGLNLGKALVKVQSSDGLLSSDPLSVSVVREVRVIDSVFTYSVAILVSIIYINFGCVLDWPVLKETIKRPIGPAIGFICQFVLMPLVSILLILLNLLSGSSPSINDGDRGPTVMD